MKAQFIKSNYTGNTKEFWNDNWSLESVERQKDALIWSGYKPIYNKYIKNNGFLLENGCGLGSSLTYLFKLNDKSIGLDYLFEPLSLLKQSDNKFKLINGNGFFLPLKNESFTYVISLGVIEHFEISSQQFLVKECYRILKKDRILILSVPYYNLFKRIRMNLSNTQQKENKKFFQYLFTTKEIKQFLINNGFNIIDIYYCNKLTPFYLLYKKLKNFFKSKEIKNLQKTHKNFKSDNMFYKKEKIINFINKLIPFFLSAAMITIVCKKNE
ncbi:MAG TPA: class I SAM-dependent methyltransferase [bacterium]|nr:class I SAM-dependent methyltransferase [bacterium]HOL48205.1 class I SAM-dependent methyltransferase [bacterium]HPQ19191.1 class I SAM-dependent methyltransferase [bacterium]